MIKKRILLQILTILLLGLLPLLWFKDGSLILGHDSGLPFDPIAHFVDRLYLWSTHYGLGIDLNNGLLGSVFLIHGLETLLSFIGFSLQNVEKIEFVFWFVLPGLTMYYVAHKMWPDKKYLPFIAALIYMINYYLLQGWFAPERTKFSFYAGFPIFIYSMLEYYRGVLSWKKSVLLAGITISILNGGGSIPLYGGLFISIAFISLYYIFIRFGIKSIFKVIAFLSGVTIIYTLLNAYWIIPYVKYVLGSFSSELAVRGGTEGTLNWTAYLSSGSSFINLLRGQGIPDWYLNPYHAYAADFFNNPFLVLISFMFPIVAFSSLLFAKNNKDKYFLYIIAFIGLISLIFASGTKSQLSFIYTSLVTYVPGFAMFRSSFYKFDYVLWFSYALMIGYTLNYLLTILEQKIKRPLFRTAFSIITLSCFVLAMLLYHFPVLSGSFLDYSSEPENALTTRINVPHYVFDFGNWVNQQDQMKRYLVLPEINDGGSFISYKWGYWSLATITSLLSRNSFVQNDVGTTGESKKIVNELYKSLRERDIKTFNGIAHVMGINGIVIQKDYDWKNKRWGSTDPAIYEQIVKGSNNFTLQKTFGEWQVYSINSGGETKRISVTNKLGYVQGNFAPITSMPYFDTRSAFYTSLTEHEYNEDFYGKATDVYISPTCNNCLLQGTKSTYVFYNPKILPGSILYPLVENQEKKVKDAAIDFNSRFNYYLTFSDRRVAEAKWMVDSNKKLDSLPSVLDRYIVILSEFKQLLNNETWTVTSVDETEMSEQLIAHILEQSKVVESMHQDEKVIAENRVKLGSAYSLLSDIIDAAQRKVWATNDAKAKNYSFDAPKAGTFQLFVKKTSLSDPDIDATNAEIATRAAAQKIKPNSQIGDWLDFGSVNLTKGKNYLSFSDPTVLNLLKGVQAILPNDRAGITISNNIYTLTSESRDKCFSIPLQNLDTSSGSVYEISFEYKNYTNGKDLAFYITDPNTNTSNLNLSDHFLTNKSGWTKYTETIKPESRQRNMVFCNGFSDLTARYERNTTNQTVNSSDISSQIQNISIYKLTTPIVVFYQNKKKYNDINENINFQRKSPVEYTLNVGNISGPVTLMLKESYGKYWELCSDRKQCFSLDDPNHFTHAGFANAWYSKNGISGKYTLYYTGQRLFYFGLGVTLLAILVLAGLFIRNKLWKKRK